MPEIDKFQLQESQYSFPYHYLPHFDLYDRVSLSRKLRWGLEYLCYQKHLQEKVVALNPASVLEVGCGDGYLIGGLPTTINKRVGVDLSEKAIAFAKAFHPECDFYIQDAAEMKETFDIVVAIEVIEHISDKLLPHFLNTLAERVKDHGRVLISAPTTVTPLTKKHYRHYTIDLLKKQLLDADCSLVVDSYEFIYSKPWWIKTLSVFIDNRIFSFEFKPIMRFVWHQVWNKYRFAKEKNGLHLVAVLKKSVQ